MRYMDSLFTYLFTYLVVLLCSSYIKLSCTMQVIEDRLFKVWFFFCIVLYREGMALH